MCAASPPLAHPPPLPAQTRGQGGVLTFTLPVFSAQPALHLTRTFTIVSNRTTSGSHNLICLVHALVSETPCIP